MPGLAAEDRGGDLPLSGKKNGKGQLEKPKPTVSDGTLFADLKGRWLVK